MTSSSSSLVLTARRPVPRLMLFRLMTLLLRIAMAGGAATAAAVGRCCGYSVGGGRHCRVQAGYLGTGLALFTIVRTPAAGAAASTYGRHLAVVGNSGGGGSRSSAAAAASDRRQRC